MYNSSLIDDPYLDGLYDAVRALPGDLRWWPRGWPEELCDDVLFHVVRHAAYRLQLCRVPDLEALLRSLADRVNADLALGLRASRRLITTRHIAAWTADPGPGRVRFVDRRGHVVAWHALFVQRGCRAALVRHAAVSLYVAGSSRSKTAAELGVSGATVTRALAARGVVTRGPAPWSAEDRKLLHAAVEDSGLLSKRAAVAEVAQQLGRSFAACWEQYKRALRREQREFAAAA